MGVAGGGVSYLPLRATDKLEYRRIRTTFENMNLPNVGVLVILLRLVQLSELPEDPEPSSSLGPCILRIIRLQLLASLAGCVLIFLLLS